ncbi:hypothetical protein CBL_03193 [Carabus blaptoides fortunei]
MSSSNKGVKFHSTSYVAGDSGGGDHRGGGTGHRTASRSRVDMKPGFQTSRTLEISCKLSTNRRTVDTLDSEGSRNRFAIKYRHRSNVHSQPPPTIILLLRLRLRSTMESSLLTRGNNLLAHV